MTSPINNAYSPSAVIRPRLRVLVNGVNIPTALSASITSTNNYHGDRYTATLAPPISGLGSFVWWEQQTDIAADVQIGLVPSGAPESAVVWQSIVQGPVDRTTHGFNAGAIQLEGRDYTAKLIDFKTELANVNQTSSEIVASLAAQVGLQSQVTQTTTPVGRYYELEHTCVQLNQFHRAITGWDEVVLLARYEGFDAFFVGDTLYFQPPVAVGSDPYLLWWQQDKQGRVQSNMVEFSAERALTVAKGVNVIVKSWHGKQARAFTRGYPSANPVGASSNVQQYLFVRPNLTEDQAQQLANQLYVEIITHERTINVTLPGDSVLTPRVLVQLTGTGTGYDQTYYPNTVRRTVGRGGYLMHLCAKNHSPQTEVAAP
jgi:hypothetical protein